MDKVCLGYLIYISKNTPLSFSLFWKVRGQDIYSSDVLVEARL